MTEEAMQGIESITVEAVVIRKDGAREDLGAVAEWDRNDPEARKGVIQFFKQILEKDN
jgi:hypothetical protein